MQKGGFLRNIGDASNRYTLERLGITSVNLAGTRTGLYGSRVSFYGSIDRCSTSYLLATLISTGVTTGSGDLPYYEGKGVRDKPSEGRGLTGEMGCRDREQSSVERTVPNLNQLSVTLLADSEGGWAGFVNCEVCLRLKLAVL